jgi:hypothetical protein
MTTVLGHRRRRREKLKQYTLESTPGVVEDPETSCSKRRESYFLSPQGVAQGVAEGWASHGKGWSCDGNGTASYRWEGFVA